MNEIDYGNVVNMLRNRLWRVKVAAYNLKSTLIIKEYGEVLTGCEELDKILAYDETNITIPIISDESFSILGFFTNDVNIRFVDENDYTTVYELCLDYLYYWATNPSVRVATFHGSSRPSDFFLGNLAVLVKRLYPLVVSQACKAANIKPTHAPKLRLDSYLDKPTQEITPARYKQVSSSKAFAEQHPVLENLIKRL